MSPTGCLFLDRDGVINMLLPGDYVKKKEEFIFIPGVIEWLQKIQVKFRYIFIITNQQGIGKGLMSEQDLKEVHDFLLAELAKNHITIHRIYYCPHLQTENCHCRKPKPGMINQAFEDFPGANPNKAILIGDSNTDILAAKAAGLRSVGIIHDFNKDTIMHAQADYFIKSFKEFYEEVIPLWLNEI